MFDCNLIKSRIQKIQEDQLAVLSAPAISGSLTPSASEIPPSPISGTPEPIYPNLPPATLPPLEGRPTIQVPSNPLLPPESRQVLDYESLQYLNGFLRTQIGKYVEVEFLVGTSNRVMRSGRLIGLGINYILLLDIETQDIIACDFYNIKFVKFYYRSNASVTA